MVREATGRQAVRGLGRFNLEAVVGLAVPSKSFRSVTTKVSLLKIPQKSEPIHMGCSIWNGLSNRESREIREKEGSERGSSASNHFTRRMNDTNSINTLGKSKACPAGVMLCESAGRGCYPGGVCRYDALRPKLLSLRVFRVVRGFDWCRLGKVARKKGIFAKRTQFFWGENAL